MPIRKGRKEYERFLRGGKFTPTQAIAAQCYECCEGVDGAGMKKRGKGCNKIGCVLYQYMPYREREKKEISEQQRQRLKAISAKGVKARR